MERRRFRIRGVVQGVGFRPFVYGLARAARARRLRPQRRRRCGRRGRGRPGRARRLRCRAARRGAAARPRGERRRRAARAASARPRSAIEASAPAGATALVPADVATCDDCLRELFDPADRRYRYPFVELHAVRAALHDRARASPTTGRTRRWRRSRCAPTAGASTRIPLDRRFHAEPIACPACGPRLSMPLEEAVGAAARRRDPRRQGARRLPPRLRRRATRRRSRACARASSARTSRSR